MTTAAPWHAHYDSGVPGSLEPYPDRTLVDYLADWARTRPAAPAVLFKGSSMTWSTLDRSSDACAAAFSALGVSRGDRIAFLLPNCPQFLIAQFGAWKIGALVAPLNPTYTERELTDALCAFGVETVVTLTRFYERVKRVQAATNVRRVIATNIKDHFPPLLRALFTLAREKREGDRVTLAADDFDLLRLLRAHHDDKPAGHHPAPDDAAVLLMSGGTTGTPKGVIGRHSAYVLAGLQIKTWTQSALSSGDVIMIPLPLFHVYANVGVQGLGLVNGNPLVLVPNPRDLNDVIATIKRTRPHFFNGVPTLYIGLTNHPDVQRGKVDFTSIKICFSGGSALMAETKQRFETLTGGRIVEGYSLTEAMMALCVNPVQSANKIGSVGMPLPDVRVRIVDPDDGVGVMAVREVGEIVFSAPQLMTGFWNQPAETAAVMRDQIEDGRVSRWLYTGDLGYLDEEGYLFIVDRKKDMIKTSGFQVWPREIEEVLAAHRAVAEVGVAGVPHPSKGEAVRAWVVLRAGEEVTAAELREYCMERLAPYKVPSQVEFRRELPKTLVGKVLRRVLRSECSPP